MRDFPWQDGLGPHVREARAVLDGNWTGSYTKPCPSLYPHQWNWDSAFIAMGYATYDQKRARRELTSLLAAQWDNGMVPQIVFNPAHLGGYFPEPDFWRVPGGRLTSGITMPPLLATACLAVHRAAPGRHGARDFLAQVYPRLVRSHAYLHRERDPGGTGLAFIRHPWESGLDNSPSWDGPLAAIRVDKARLPAYQRRDLSHGVPAADRPTDDDYDRYVFLVDLFRRLAYDEAQIAAASPFLVQDVLFNAILCQADRDLAEIAGIVGQDPQEPRAWAAATAQAISETLWSPERGQFDPRCLVTGKLLPTATAASFLPLYCGAASPEQAARLYQRLDSVSFCALHQGNCFTVPNFDMAREEFDSRNYWRGPVWININWLLAQGLARYGFREKADNLRKDLLQLPIRFGFHEYFDSLTGRGHGAAGFSWSAALFLDLAHRYYRRESWGRTWLGLGPGRPGRRRVAPVVLNRPAGGPPPPPDLASRLMQAVGEMRDNFYDPQRGMVAYQDLKESAAYRAYRELAAGLDQLDPASLTGPAARRAFWINLYNSLVVHGIVELEIAASVREVAGFFRVISYRIGGRDFTPDAVEHGVLRGNRRPPYRLWPEFRPGDPRRALALPRLDPRLHFALVCGSRSCAPIKFYTAQGLDAELETAARNFVNSSEVVVLPERNKIMLSRIFQWYGRDFGGWPEIAKFLLRHLDPGPPAGYLAGHADTIRVEFLPYDWNLNRR